MYVELDEAVCLAGTILNVLLMRERGPAGRAVSDPLGFPSPGSCALLNLNPN
jgi:hypothetical protein